MSQSGPTPEFSKAWTALMEELTGFASVVVAGKGHPEACEQNWIELIEILRSVRGNRGDNIDFTWRDLARTTSLYLERLAKKLGKVS